MAKVCMVDLVATPVDSTSGQEFIRRQHSESIAKLWKHTAIREQLLPQPEADKLLNRLLKSSGNLASLTYPHCYLAAISVLLLPIWLDQFDRGLDCIPNFRHESLEHIPATSTPLTAIAYAVGQAAREKSLLPSFINIAHAGPRNDPIEARGTT